MSDGDGPGTLEQCARLTLRAPGMPGRVAVIFLQPRCNMHCTFCITEDNFDAMTFAQGVVLLEWLHDEGVRTVVLGGGEPFDWPHNPISLAAEAKRLGFLVQIGTNGIAVPQGFERSDAVDRWVLPLESVEPESHNRMRLYRDRHHGIILDRLAALKRARKSVTISTVITEVNKTGVLDVAEFLRREHEEGGHVHAWHLYQFIPIGRGGAVHGDSLKIAREEYEEIVEAMRAMDLPFRVYRRADMYRSQTVDFFWYAGGGIRRGSEEWGRSGAPGVADGFAAGELARAVVGRERGPDCERGAESSTGAVEVDPEFGA